MTLIFDNRYDALGERFYASLYPDPLPNPRAVIFNDDALETLGLKQYGLDDLLSFFSGNSVPEGAAPLAMVYAGHQFGGYSPQLGDGRGILIGQIRNKKGTLIDLHLKGAGKTPFSRMGDGRAVLRSCIREFLASEALHHLGIPSTRALAVTTSNEPVQRETIENASMLMRFSESHIRFGSFEYFAYTEQFDELRQLCDYTLENHFPQIVQNETKYDDFLCAVAEKTGSLIAQWQAFGFAHGVMNTDNMSILGLTIDYGPYGWMDDYDPNFTPNTTDLPHKRYRFSNQPMIAQWNLMALGKALMPLINDEQSIVSILNDFATHYEEKYHAMMSSKLGLEPSLVSKEFLQNLESLLEKDEMDMTMFYSQLLEIDSSTQQNEFIHILKDVSYNSEKMSDKFVNWLVEYQLLLKGSSLTSHQRRKLMQKVNPRYVLRNYMNQMAIEAAYQGDFGLVEEFFEMIKSPYTKNEKYEKWFAKRPDWAKEKIGSSMLSCSS